MAFDPIAQYAKWPAPMNVDQFTAKKQEFVENGWVQVDRKYWPNKWVGPMHWNGRDVYSTSFAKPEINYGMSIMVDLNGQTPEGLGI